jgi:hypothetical protein
MVTRDMTVKYNKAIFEGPHPAVRWAENACLDLLQIDCVTALTLNILDNKCTMNLEEQLALLAIYQAVRPRKGLLFDDSVHEAIAHALREGDERISRQIHAYRVQAESLIPQPVMQYFKQYLRESLFAT